MLANQFGHQVNLTLIKQAISNQPLKLQWLSGLPPAVRPLYCQASLLAGHPAVRPLICDIWPHYYSGLHPALATLWPHIYIGKREAAGEVANFRTMLDVWPVTHNVSESSIWIFKQIFLHNQIYHKTENYDIFWKTLWITVKRKQKDVLIWLPHVWGVQCTVYTPGP